jgi:hypothetical protein
MASQLLGAVTLSAALVACSSSDRSPASPPSSDTASSVAADSAQTYLDAVNALCDALLPKIVAVTHGGSVDVPAHEYLATWPAHKRLLTGFDKHLAAIPVPTAAHAKAATLAAYVRFADHLDTGRLRAARKGQSFYAKEVRAEAGADTDPAIARLSAAGFNDSCTAR